MADEKEQDEQRPITWQEFQDIVIEHVGSDDPNKALAVWYSLMEAPSDRQNLAARFLEAMIGGPGCDINGTKEALQLAFNMADGILEGDGGGQSGQSG